MFHKYNKYIIFILIVFFVFTQSPDIENMENKILTEITSSQKNIEEQITQFNEDIRKCNIDGTCNTKLDSLKEKYSTIESYIHTYFDEIQTLNNSILSQHTTFNSKIEQNKELKEKNEKLLKRIEELEDKEDSSYGMIESYKKKYFSTIVELVMIILCVIFLTVLLYTELSKK
tara:strand:+ start:4217 stop:4735 length:519 start_codon:yes stop_codon:yes gene_type:complete